MSKVYLVGLIDETPHFYEIDVPPEVGKDWGDWHKFAYDKAAGLGFKDKNSYDFFMSEEKPNYIGFELFDGEVEIWSGNTVADMHPCLDYVYDARSKQMLDKIPIWKNRKDVKSFNTALELLSLTIMQNLEWLSDDDLLEEMKEFASRWNIPFSLDLMSKFADMFNETYPNWDSSSYKC